MAGSGRRFGGPRPKIFATLAGEPLWRHAARTLVAVPGCRRLVLVTAVDRIDEVTQGAADLPLARVTVGGERRQDSVRLGLAAIDVAADVVAVHDAARPLLRISTAARAVAVAAEHGAALVAVPVSDTIKEVDGGGQIVGTPDRARLWQAQTPQCFATDVLLRAHEQAARDGVVATDDAALVELLGHPVPVVRGDRWNLKVTEPQDLVVAAALLERRRSSADAPGETGENFA